MKDHAGVLTLEMFSLGDNLNVTSLLQRMVYISLLPTEFFPCRVLCGRSRQIVFSLAQEFVTFLKLHIYWNF